MAGEYRHRAHLNRVQILRSGCETTSMTTRIPARDQLAGTGLPDRYALLQRVASGGMATVWCAEDVVLGRRVAIKLLADHFADDFVAVRRFKREARTAARVSSHPNIITIFDVGETVPSDRRERARPFIVMEHLPGGTVADALRTGEVSRDAALQWIREASSALDFAHEHGVIHRDIKPANMLLPQPEPPRRGLRDRPDRPRGHDHEGRPAVRHRRLPVPSRLRASPGPGERPVRARRRRVRTADRPAAVHGRALRRPGAGARRGRAPGRERGQPLAAAGGRQRARARTRKAPGRPLAERRRVRRRADRGDPRPRSRSSSSGCGSRTRPPSSAPSSTPRSPRSTRQPERAQSPPAHATATARQAASPPGSTRSTASA